ncbi:MAG TPA: hypothetical protein VGF90_05495 [Verrucomicrobiae bacterium]
MRKPTAIEDEQAAPRDDLLWGAQAIADFLGIPVDSVYYLIRRKRLPIGKLGPKTIIASRKKLQRALNDQLKDGRDDDLG